MSRRTEEHAREPVVAYVDDDDDDDDADYGQCPEEDIAERFNPTRACYQAGGGAKRPAATAGVKRQAEHTTENPSAQQHQPVPGEEMRPSCLVDECDQSNDVASGSSSPFPVAEAVYNRLKWDRRFNTSTVSIGYEDRFIGLKVVPFTKFRGGNAKVSSDITIPFHRVRQFRVGDSIVWDRDNKLCTLDGLAEAGTAAAPDDDASAAPCIKSPPPRLLKHVSGRKLDVTPPTVRSATGNGTKATLRVLNFNVLHDLFDRELIFTEERLPLIARLLEDSDADITLLQEVTPHFFAALRLASPKLCATQYWTALPSDVNTVQMTLSKHPIIEAVAAATSGKKRCVYAVVDVPALGLVSTANCHLLSDYGQNPIVRRAAEFGLICKHMKAIPDQAVVCKIISGDFNFGDQNVEQRTFDWQSYQDAWLVAKGITDRFDPHCELAKAGEIPSCLSSVGGFTYDLRRNWIADAMTQGHRYPRRLDRTLFDAPGFHPASCTIVGDQAVQLPTGPKKEMKSLFPSDHFGLLTDFSIDDSRMRKPSTDVPSDRAHWTDSLTVSPQLRAMRETHETIRPHFRSALVFLLPSEFWAPINAVRQEFDKAYPRWMPHMTILFPFVPEYSIKQTVDYLNMAFAEGRALLPGPFPLKFASTIGAFEGKKTVFFLQPESPRKGAEMQQIFSFVEDLFPSMRRADRSEYVPHATLGQCAGGKQAEHTLRSVEQRLATAMSATGNFQFNCDRLHFIVHVEGAEGFEVVAEFLLPE